MYFHQQSNSIINPCLLSNTNLSTSSYQPSFINNVGTSLTDIGDENPVNKAFSEINDDVVANEFHAQIPLFLINNKIIKVPSKVPHAIERFTPKWLLKAIHPDVEVAKEMCLIFLTQLNSTYFAKKEDEDSEGWKALKATYLRDLISFDSMAYKRITEALEHPLTKGAILECDHDSVVGVKSFHYRIGNNYMNRGMKEYELRTKQALTVLNKHYFRILSEANQNPICKNLIRMYADITLPTKEQIIKEAKRLKKEDYQTKKGKRLVFLNKHPRSYYKNPEQLSFVEDAIEIFDYLTSNGLLVPSVGDEKSGGRIVDSLTLMPSWIRRLIKWNGKNLHECDYSALHPNIAISLYGGKTKYLKHGDLKNELGLDIRDVKIEHLSFFNKTVHQMKESPLFQYYESKEPQMLNNIIAEKYSSPHKYKVTPRRMFAKEVEIMTDVIKQLNSEGIYVLYVYDALLCAPNDTERVLDVMDFMAAKHNVHTVAKYTGKRKYNPLTAEVKDKVLDEETLQAISPKSISVPVIPANELNFGSSIKEEILGKINSGIELEFFEAEIRFPDGSTEKDKVRPIRDMINPTLKYVLYSYVMGTLNF